MARQNKVHIIRDKISESLFSENWQAGERFSSEPQLVLKYGVSRQTVRKALQELIDAGYLRPVKGSGTFVTEKAVAKRYKRSYSIGILVTYLSDYIFPTIIRELEEVFTLSGFTVQLASTGNSTLRERELLQKMLANKVDGIVLEPTKSALPNPNADLYQELLERGFPLVTIHSTYKDMPFPTVALDDEEAGFMAGTRLLEQHLGPVAAILKSDDLQGHRRYQGLLKAHRAYHMTFDDQKVFWYATEDIKYFPDQASALLERVKGSRSIVCYNDQIGLMLEEILLSRGFRIPEDFAIVSIDDSRLAPLAPVPLTSVHSPIREIGQTAARHLLRLINGEQFNPEKIFTPTLTERKSG